MQNNNKRFTSYDRSSITKLDYAINRTYDSKLGRFTQVDPIGLSSVELKEPQTLNLYTYCGNDPINHIDPDGLFFGKLFKWLGSIIKNALKWIAVVVSIAVAVLTIIYAPILFTSSLKLILGLVGVLANATSSVLTALGYTKAAAAFGFISAFASFGTAFLAARSALNWKTLLGAVSAAATATSRTLSYFGHTRLGHIFGLVGNVAGFISGGLRVIGDRATGFRYSWDSSVWKIYKFARSSAEQIANITGATQVAGYLNVAGIVDDVGDSYIAFQNFREAMRQIRNRTGAGALSPPAQVSRLNFLSNTRTLLTGSDLANAQVSIVLVNFTRAVNDQVGRYNRIAGRVERGIALAR